MPRANGYRLEGVLKQDSIEKGVYRDTFVFAKLRSEYEAKRPYLFSTTGLDHVRLSVKDLHASRDWYSRVLGTSPSEDTAHYVEFRVGQNALALIPADEKSPTSRGGQIAYWRVHDLGRAIQHFMAQGAEVYRGPLDIERGEGICQLLDPLGGALGLIGRRGKRS